MKCRAAKIAPSDTMMKPLIGIYKHMLAGGESRFARRAGALDGRESACARGRTPR